VSRAPFLIPNAPDFRNGSQDLEHLQGRVCTHASAGVEHYRLKHAPLSSMRAHAGEDAYVTLDDHPNKYILHATVPIFVLVFIFRPSTHQSAS
jgi:hypothetical protein